MDNSLGHTRDSDRLMGYRTGFLPRIGIGFAVAISPIPLGEVAHVPKAKMPPRAIIGALGGIINPCWCRSRDSNPDVLSDLGF